MRNQDEINDYMNKAYSIMIEMRDKSMFEEEKDSEELKELQEEICYLCKEYDVDFYSAINNFYYGYWTGIVSALRWINGDEKDFVE